ncbi:helix-turn-helix transcriptional regulator [Endozoicomonas sp. ONNA2]|uniref:helix-turn-helix domain-containing protein n=1 Tax=Endozoicomonas sp. ONNA2 TaxID=2828741 RepID=UPI00214722D9|nr:helix-turn-helix transcriptional regulator [Endozoicomonas sp. ONNA2]
MAPRIITQEDRNKAQKLKALFESKKKELGLTQVKCAEKLKITQSAVSQFFNAIVPLNTDTILSFAELLETKPSDIDPKLSEDRFKTKEMFHPVPIIGTISNRQPRDYYRKLWLKNPDYHAVGFEIDEDTVDYEKNSILILLLNKKPRKNNNVLIRLRKRTRFQTGKYLGEDTFDLNGVVQKLTANEISYLAKISEVVRP